MWKPSTEALRQMQVASATIASCNTFLIVAAFGFGTSDSSWTNSSLFMLPQILINIYALFYCYFKYLLAHRKIVQLGLSTVLAGVYIFFAVKIFNTVTSSGQVLSRIVVAANILIAILLLAEAGLTLTIVDFDKPFGARSGTASTQAQSGTGTGAVTETETEGGVQIPQQVHIYQPRLTLTILADGHRRQGSALSGTATPTGGEGTAGSTHSPLSVDEAFHLDIGTLEGGGEEGDVDGNGDEALELEVLPKYQRRPPAQSATIIDLSNLQGVDPAVLTSVLGESAEGIQNGVPEEVPGYSPPLPTLSPVSSLNITQSSTLGQEESEELETRITAMAVSMHNASVPPQSISTTAQVPPTSEPPVYMP
ncbi:hypothetical protein BGZ58_005680 [Dissophora ornata]|nr:hypothetical protein BGZ58_005680 [Dissophora ornata]